MHVTTPHIGQIAPQLGSDALTLLTADDNTDSAGISAHVPDLTVQTRPVEDTNALPHPPLTPALIREFETVLHQTLTPPHTPPTYIELVNNQVIQIKFD